jgi:hypothetical protein
MDQAFGAPEMALIAIPKWKMKQSAKGTNYVSLVQRLQENVKIQM